MMDMHCHVDLYPDHDAILRDIKDCGFYVLSVTTVPSAFKGTTNLTRGIKHCKTALGLHPQLAHLRKSELSLFDELVGETRYIGEIGLDGSKGYKEHLNDQLIVFNHILKKCESFGDKILTIHSLNAVDLVLDSLAAHPNAGKPILHWFLGNKRQITFACELGCFFSVGPSMLNSARARKAISWIPRERVLLETDGPFAKVKGKALIPSDVTQVIDYFCTDWELPSQSVLDTLSANLRNLVNV